MLEISKRLALGVFLILLAAAVLLYTDQGSRGAGRERGGQIKVALVEHASTRALEEGANGALQALASRGYEDGGRITLRRFNAE
ncbi:MAG: hypothetical protein RIR25_8, partial [Verrucomicrobiota bacterium]